MGPTQKKKRQEKVLLLYLSRLSRQSPFQLHLQSALAKSAKFLLTYIFLVPPGGVLTADRTRTNSDLDGRAGAGLPRDVNELVAAARKVAGQLGHLAIECYGGARVGFDFLNTQPPFERRGTAAAPLSVIPSSCIS